MKLIKEVSVVMLFFVLLFSCEKKNENQEINKRVFASKIENVSLHISGMTCEIGCAKTIQSKLSKKEGVKSAKVVFKDSIATIEFDINKISKFELIDFVDGIAGGELYKASEIK